MEDTDEDPNTMEDKPVVEVDPKILKTNAIAYMMRHACTTHDEVNNIHSWRPIWGTSTNELGIYGTGIQLYFEFLKMMGVLFLIGALLSLPSLSLNIVGNMVVSSSSLNRFLGGLSVGNLGSCSSSGCTSLQEMQDRCAIQFSGTCPYKITAATSWIGIVDGVIILLFIVTAEIYHHWWIHRTTSARDQALSSCSDYTVAIRNLPYRLSEAEHPQFEEQIRNHFLKVLKQHGRYLGGDSNKGDEGLDDSEAIVEVAIVRDYDGSIKTFQEKGAIMQRREVSRVLEVQAMRSSKTTAVKKLRMSIDKEASRISHIDSKLKDQAQTTDEDRAVCMAFVTFKLEQYHAMVLYEYRFSQYFITRLFQQKRLRFHGYRLEVKEAMEPNDLYWENLDFSPRWRLIRQIFTVVSAFAILVGTSLVLCYFSALGTVNPAEANVATYLLKNTASSGVKCQSICQFKLFQDALCEDSSVSSASWPIVAIFDADHTYSVQNSTSLWSQTCSSIMESPACSSSSSSHSLSNDWIGITFTQARRVGCYTVTRPVSNYAQELQIWYCANSPNFTDPNWNTSWRPDQACQASMIEHPDNLVSGNATLSGPVEALPDIFCHPGITFAQAITARDYALSQPVQLLGSTQTQPATLDTVISNPTVACFCQSMLDQRGYSFLVPQYTSAEAQFCQQWSRQQINILGYLAAGIIAVLVLNAALLFVYGSMVDFERPISFTDLSMSQLWKLFIAQFVNTGILVLVINFSIKRYPTGWSWLQVLAVGRGSFDDMSSGWYTAVGSGIILQIAIQLVSNTLPLLLSSFIVAPIMLRFSSKFVTQHAMDQFYLMPQFNLSLRLAQTMNVIFVILMYSAGMPAMYILGCLYCIVCYWTDKIILLRASSKPPSYSDKIMRFCMNMFPLAALLHIFMACWTFGSPYLFPSDWSSLHPMAQRIFRMSDAEYNDVYRTYPSAPLDQQAKLQTRYLSARFVDFSRKGCSLLFMLWCIFIVYYTAWYAYEYALRPFLRPCFDLGRSICQRKSHTHETGTTKTFAEVHEEIVDRIGMSSYKMRANGKYKNACLALKDTARRVKAQEYEASVGPAVTTV